MNLSSERQQVSEWATGLVAIYQFAGERQVLLELGDIPSLNRQLTFSPDSGWWEPETFFSVPDRAWAAFKPCGNDFSVLSSPCLFACYVPDGVAGTLRGPLQPYNPLRPPHLLQLSAQTALQEHLLLLPAAHLQAESGEAAMCRRDSHYSHLQIHPSLQLWGVQLIM